MHQLVEPNSLESLPLVYAIIHNEGERTAYFNGILTTTLCAITREKSQTLYISVSDSGENERRAQTALFQGTTETNHRRETPQGLSLSFLLLSSPPPLSPFKFTEKDNSIKPH